MKGIFKTKGINEEKGKPHIIALMLTNKAGVSLPGGAMAAGVHLTFGIIVAFRPEQWEEITVEEYRTRYGEENKG